MMGTTVTTDTAPKHSEALEEVRQYWNNHIHDWKVAESPPGTPEFFAEIEAYRFEKLHYLPRLVDFSGFRGANLLEVGCGVANDLSRFAKGGAIVTGIDLAQKSIELAKHNFAQRGLSGNFLVMDGENLGFPSDSFDAVYCHTVLHFTPDPAKMVREIHRVLKPNSAAILMTVNRRSWLNAMKVLANVEIDHLDAPVFHQFSISEFQELLRPFSVARIQPERFPVPTKVHSGFKARIYNTLFVGTFNAMPRQLVQSFGHHLMAFCQK